LRVRLAAGKNHDVRAALLHGGQAMLDGEVLSQDVAAVLDLPAARTGEGAAKQRLEHEHQGIATVSPEALLEDVGRDRPHLRQRNAHAFWLSMPGPMAGRW